MTKTFDIVNGVPVADVSTLNASAALARKRVVERRLGELRVKLEQGPAWGAAVAAMIEERDELKREDVTLSEQLRVYRERQKQENTRRNFAGIGSPFYEAVVERCSPELIAVCETAAMAKQTEREQRAAARRAAKK